MTPPKEIWAVIDTQDGSFYTTERSRKDAERHCASYERVVKYILAPAAKKRPKKRSKK
jgi:hypothetical protein